MTLKNQLSDTPGIKLGRRDFLSASAAAISAIPLGMYSGLSMAADKQWPGFKDTIVIDALGGFDNPNARGGQDDMLDARSIHDARQSGITAVNITLGYVFGDMDPFEYSVTEMAAWDDYIRRHSNDFVKVLSTQDIVNAKENKKVGIIYGFQNSEMLGDDVERVDTFANLGARVVQLTYNLRNKVGDGSMVKENRGLTKFGHEVIERLNDRQVLVDLSHSGENTALDAIRASKKPIAITHSGCRALADLPRNKTDEELRLLADKGGVVGIYFMPFLKVGSQPYAEDVVRHIEHAVNICGEDHVGFGTDGSIPTIDDMAGFKEDLREHLAERKRMGISAPGESMDVVPFIPDLMGPEKFQRLADLLYQRGHSSARIEKILGKNFLRLMQDVWPA